MSLAGHLEIDTRFAIDPGGGRQIELVDGDIAMLLVED